MKMHGLHMYRSTMDTPQKQHDGSRWSPRCILRNRLSDRQVADVVRPALIGSMASTLN